MRKFNVVVEGKSYQVEVEEIGASATPSVVAAPASVVSAPVVANVAAPVAVAAPVISGGVQLKAPLPGMIVNFKVDNGATVKKGQVVLVLEAMKMENDIVAPADGKINFVVAKGATVATNAVLATIG